MASDLRSAASEFSSRTVQAFGPTDGRLLACNAGQGSKRGLHVARREDEDTIPSKRAASSRPDDLSCTEETLFDRLPDSSCVPAHEAESRLVRRIEASAMPSAADLKEMIRLAYATECVEQPSPSYMRRHGPAVQSAQYLEPSMRTVAVSWMVEVACEFSLQQDTLFLAVSLLDRFLSVSKAVPRNSLQLLAVACTLIAAKHEETDAVPSVRAFTNIADHCFQVPDLLRVEALILHTLKFRVMRPNAYTMHCLLRKATGVPARAAALAMYLMELALLEYGMLRYRPSQVASAALLLAQVDKENLEAAAALESVVPRPLTDLHECAAAMRGLQQRAFDTSDAHSPITAVKEKYRDVRWHCVSHEIPVEDDLLALLAAAGGPQAQ